MDVKIPTTELNICKNSCDFLANSKKSGLAAVSTMQEGVLRVVPVLTPSVKNRHGLSSSFSSALAGSQAGSARGWARVILILIALKLSRLATTVSGGILRLN